MSFTPEELAAMAAADVEIEALFADEWRAERRARDRAYYAANKEKMQAKMRAWRKANPERSREFNRKSYHAHKDDEAFKAKRRAYYQANKEKFLARSRAYYQAHRDDPEYKAKQKARGKAFFQAHKEELNAKAKERYRILSAALPTEGMVAIRERRKSLYLSQREFGALFGVTASTVCRWENLKAPENWREIVERTVVA